MKSKNSSSKEEAKQFFKKPLFWPISLVIVVALVIAGFGLSSWAAGHSRQLEYVQATNLLGKAVAFVPVTSTYVKQARRNYQAVCDAQAFSENYDKIVYSDRAYWDDHLKDRDVAVVCFRIEGNQDHYYYAGHWLTGAVSGPDLTVEEIYDQPGTKDTKPGGDMTKLFVSAGLHYPEPGEQSPKIEYTPVVQWGDRCDEATFADAIKYDGRYVFSADSGSYIDLERFGLGQYPMSTLEDEDWAPPPAVYPGIGLCLRTKIDTEYYYVGYKEENYKPRIHFKGGWNNYDPNLNPQESSTKHFDDLYVHASGASILAWNFISLGEECLATTFEGDGIDGIHVFPGMSGGDDQLQLPTGSDDVDSPFSYYGVVLPAKDIDYPGICFRATYADGSTVYAAHERFSNYVWIEVVYKFTLAIEQANNRHLYVNSSREISRWRAIRSDVWADYGACRSQTFEVASKDKSRIKSGQINRPHQAEVFDIEIGVLEGDDVGRLYCVEVIDLKGNKAYIISSIIEPYTSLSVWAYYYQESPEADYNMITAFTSLGSAASQAISWEVVKVEVPAVQLPANWADLTLSEKIAANPYGCLNAEMIADDGRCPPGSSTTEMICDFDSNQAVDFYIDDAIGIDIPVMEADLTQRTLFCIRASYHVDPETDSSESAEVGIIPADEYPMNTSSDDDMDES